MLKKRIIPCLDIREGRVTKGIAFKNNVDIGDPVELSKFYSDHGADEIVIYDIAASPNNVPPDFKTIEAVAAKSFIPICIGGGIRSFDDAARCISSGAEKVSLNSVAPKNPSLISDIAEHFGVQAVVLSLDVRVDTSCSSGYRLVIHGGRTDTPWDLLDWVKFAVPRGVGELCVNSIDQDGRRQGFDRSLIRLLKGCVNVPIIISGGAGSAQHVADALNDGADAALVASIVHSGETTLRALKQLCADAGLAMRMDW